jgi:hypothetical protein
MIEDLSRLLDRLGMPDTRSPYADEGRRPTADHRPFDTGPRNNHPRDETRQLFPSRDFR